MAVLHSHLLSAVIPRPIALASTIDANGNVNLSPFSFFNCFGSNPPLLIFSPNRRVREDSTKHTYENVLAVPEVVIHIVNYKLVQQTSLASTEYERGVNEFIKAGFTSVPSTLVSPPRVGEAPIAIECKVREVISTGEKGGSSNLILCEVLLLHINEDVLGDDGKVDPVKLDAVARLGGDYYARIIPEAIFKVPKPLDKIGIGLDNLPEEIRLSPVLTGNDLAQLANVSAIPPVSKLPSFDITSTREQHIAAQKLISENKISEAWQILLQPLGTNRGT